MVYGAARESFLEIKKMREWKLENSENNVQIFKTVQYSIKGMGEIEMKGKYSWILL